MGKEMKLPFSEKGKLPKICSPSKNQAIKPAKIIRHQIKICLMKVPTDFAAGGEGQWQKK